MITQNGYYCGKCGADEDNVVPQSCPVCGNTAITVSIRRGTNTVKTKTFYFNLVKYRIFGMWPVWVYKDAEDVRKVAASFMSDLNRFSILETTPLRSFLLWRTGEIRVWFRD